MIKKILFLLTILFISSCGNNNKNEIKFDRPLVVKNAVTPSVKINIGNKKANMLLDTGSEITIIDDDFFIENKELFDIKTEQIVEITTLNGNTTMDVKIASCYVNDSINTVFYVFDIDDNKENVFIKSGIYIDGIIGCDFLYKNKLVIDFNNKRLKTVEE